MSQCVQSVSQGSPFPFPGLLNWKLTVLLSKYWLCTTSGERFAKAICVFKFWPCFFAHQFGQALIDVKEKSLMHMWCYIHLKVKSMQRSGTEAIRTQHPALIITKITNSQNTIRTYGQPNERLFPKRWLLSNPNRTKNKINTLIN